MNFILQLAGILLYAGCLVIIDVSQSMQFYFVEVN